MWLLFQDLERPVAEWERHTGRTFQVLQVKEKLGGLRVYVVSDASPAIHERVDTAERESYCLCEVCGRPGVLRERLLRTLCDTHAEEELRPQ